MDSPSLFGVNGSASRGYKKRDDARANYAGLRWGERREVVTPFGGRLTYADG